MYILQVEETEMIVMESEEFNNQVVVLKHVLWLHYRLLKLPLVMVLLQ